MTHEPHRYGVIGHPVAHSLSPAIHAAFAAATGLVVDYRRVSAPVDGFVATATRFFDEGGEGLNVTLPFKVEARALCGERVSPRARMAGAVNWLGRDEYGLHGDNTDGAGLVDDLKRLVGSALTGARVLLVGAGGSARGVVGPLFDAAPRSLVVVARDRRRADTLVATCAARDSATIVRASAFDELAGESFDVVVNATSASLARETLPLAPPTFAKAGLAYDLMYAARPTPFMTQAIDGGASQVVDGLGMLVAQAAESFFLWRGVRPETAPVRALMRSLLAAGTTR